MVFRIIILLILLTGCEEMLSGQISFTQARNSDTIWHTLEVTDSVHNCRFWGMLTSGSFQDGNKLSHLEALKELANSNPNGWGMGFYTQTSRGGSIPVVYNGMWRADQDMMYDSCASLMIKNLSNCGIAHIRNASTGYVNIPDPHPFITRSTTRNFSMIFAHNGSLDINMLRKFLGPYPQQNHYLYSENGTNNPNHDTDLYRLFLMKWIDEHPGQSITQCLVDALKILTEKMGSTYSYNFVMGSESDTMWALRYNSSLVYHREEGDEGYVWEVASQSPGESGWNNAWNYYLYVFSPGNATPDSVMINTIGSNVNGYEDESPVRFSCANPFSGESLEVFFEANTHCEVIMKLSNIKGDSIITFEPVELYPGRSSSNLDMQGLIPGIYYLSLTSGRFGKTLKLIFSGPGR